MDLEEQICFMKTLIIEFLDSYFYVIFKIMKYLKKEKIMNYFNYVIYQNSTMDFPVERNILGFVLLYFKSRKFIK